MSATPIFPGLAYRVKHNGQARIVYATNPIDALLIAIGEGESV